MNIVNVFKKLSDPRQFYLAVKQRFLRDEFRVMKWDGQLFCGNPKTKHLATLVYRGLEWEPEVVSAFVSELRPGMTVVDVGAEHGYYALLAAKRVGPQGKVIALEPIKSNYHLTKVNVHLNCYENIDVRQIALFSREQEMGIETKGQNLVGQVGADRLEGEMIKLVKGDDILLSDEVGRIDLIKMDIEGAELDALHGLKNVIEKYRPRLIIEVHVPFFKKFNRSYSELINFLSKMNYDFKAIELDDSVDLTKESEVVKHKANFHIICKCKDSV